VAGHREHRHGTNRKYILDEMMTQSLKTAPKIKLDKISFVAKNTNVNMTIIIAQQKNVTTEP